jgi:predicted aldo/keto reductase-like oxidoreductase
MMGGSFPEYGPRLLRFAYNTGVRAFDCGDWYAGEKAEGYLGEFTNQLPRREDVFVVTKRRIYNPKNFYDGVVEALERMRLPHVDLFMVHGIKDPAIPLDRDGGWRRLKDRLVREKKTRFMGFSCHLEMPERIESLINATKGGWVDAVLLACDPHLIRSDDAFNKAIDVCAKAGIGLMAMKTTRGLGRATNQPDEAKDVFTKLGLSPHHAMYKGIWSDGRFAAVCTEMPNRRYIKENAAAARAFDKPFAPAEWEALDEGMRKLSRATCPGCDGSCRHAAGTQTDFCSIARYLAYYEEDGKREIARDFFAKLPPEQRDWRGADLVAASRACRARLDFPAILARARRLLG